MEVQSCDGYKATLSKSDRSSFIFVSKALFIATQLNSNPRRVELSLLCRRSVYSDLTTAQLDTQSPNNAAIDQK